MAARVTVMPCGVTRLQRSVDHCSTGRWSEDIGKHGEEAVVRDTLDGHAVIDWLCLFSARIDSLAPLLDDLDALGGGDGDTGRNAQLTLHAILERLNTRSAGEPGGSYPNAVSASRRAHAARVTDVLAHYAHTAAMGHVGVIVANFVATMARETVKPTIRPVDARHILTRFPQVIEDTMSHPHPDLLVMVNAAADAARHFPDPIESCAMLVGGASMEAQEALIEVTDGWVNPGACVVALAIASWHATYEEATHPVDVVVDMVTTLATSGTQQAGRNHHHTFEPVAGEAFAVDFDVDFLADEHSEYVQTIAALGVRYSMVGGEDVLGAVSWHFHVDTSAIAAVIPQVWVHGILVRDTRSSDLIGKDELAVREEESGVLYLSCPSWQRADTVRVIALVRHPALAAEVASTGAHTILAPDASDAATIAQIARRAPAGVSVILSGDEDAHTLATRVRTMLIGAAHDRENGEDSETPADALRPIVIDEPLSDIAVATVARECAAIYVPSAGDASGMIAEQIARAAADRARARVAVITATDAEGLTSKVSQLAGYGLQRAAVIGPMAWRMAVVDTVATALAQRGIDEVAVESIEGTRPHVVLVNR